MTFINNLTLESISLAALAILAFAFTVNKIFKEFKLSEAGDTMLKLMHEELERMSTQNTVLSNELNKLQQEIIQLNTQLRKLCVENDKLQTELVTLTTELNTFKLNNIKVG